MDRRSFLLNAMLASAGLTLSGPASAIRSCTVGQTLNNRILVNVMLNGGPDFRHMFVPPYDATTNSYGNKYWEVRQRAHGIGGDQTDWQNRWNNDFFHLSDGGVDFGMLNRCGWLHTMWQQGKVAIICNSLGSTSRNHSESVIVMNQGNLESQENDKGRSGWGGRLASLAGGNALALTDRPSEFCFGLHPSGDINLVDKSNLIATNNTRSFGLFEYDYAGQNLTATDPDQNDLRYDSEGRLSRTLKSYYGGKRATITGDSPFFRFMESERKVREFGAKINAIIDDPNCAEPDEIRALYSGDVLPGQGPERLLSRSSFGRQIRNLHDCIMVNQDLVMKVASLERGGWDSHDDQRNGIEDNFEDLFGTDKAFDMLYRNLDDSDKGNLCILFAGEFGRQLRDNGGFGTDHGKGNIIVLVGDRVQGGIYGEMFPQSEVDKLNDPRQYSPDIDGKTELDHIYGAVCDWVQPGSSSGVFPSMSSRIIETPGMFSNLLTG